jgi:Uma2 family endonuclease
MTTLVTSIPTTPSTGPVSSRTGPSPLRVRAGHNGIRLTADEFDGIESFEHGFRFELIEGVLVVSPPPLDAEVGPNEYLGHLLLAYRESHPQGGAMDGTLPERTVYGGPNRRRADRAIWAGLGRLPDTRADRPAILVEFVSEDRRDWLRDYVGKRTEYLGLGVREYWVFDRFARTMTVWINEPTGIRECVVREPDTYRTPLLPGFELPLARQLAVADRWSVGR